MPLDRTLEEIFAAHSDAIQDDLRVCLPAVVTNVNASRQTVDVQITVQNPLFDVYGNVIFEQLTSISDVPLATMRGGGFMVWLPVAVGDSVMLLFSDLSMDTWRASQGDQAVEPGWVGKHTADSPIAFPCIFPDTKAFMDPGTNKVIIGKDGAQAQIRISATDIELGASATDFAALASKVDANFAAVTSALAAGVSGAVPGTDGGHAAFAAALAAFSPNPTGSTLIKAQ